MSVNKVILIGNLGKDPEVRHLDNGRAVARFTIATNERYKDKNGVVQTQTEWHNISLWTPLAEIAEKYLKKGSQVYIEGKISTREYTDPKDNVQKRFTEIEGRNLTLLGGSNNTSSGGESPYTESQEASKLSSISSSTIDDGDLPF